MPQMAPMNWLTLYIMFMMLFMIITIMNYYFFIYNNNNKLNNKIIKLSINWKW